MAGYIRDNKQIKKTDWCTPAKILDPCKRIVGGRFDLDPCSNSNSIVDAKTNFVLPVDGLAQDWSKYNDIWLNPPFGTDKERGTNIGFWVEKLANTYRQNKDGHKFLLLPASVDTRYWQNIIFKDHDLEFNKICFLRGRVTFIGAEAPILVPTAVVYWGHFKWAFEQEFSELGKVI